MGMTKEEVLRLCERIKNFYPQFTFPPEKVDAWLSRLQYVKLKDAMDALNGYVDEDTTGRVPALGVLINKPKDDVWQFARVDAARNILLWMPTPEKKIEKLVRWNQKKNVWEDEDGYEWGFPGE